MLRTKNILILFVLLSFSALSAQKWKKDFHGIIHSSSIYEIDAFLRDAHEDDPRRAILKPRLIDLLNEYITDAHPADQRIKEFQEKLALLKRRPSTKISFEEMNAINKKKNIALYRAELEKKNGSTITYENQSYGASGNSSATTDTGSIADAGTINAAEKDEFKTLMDVKPEEHKKNTVNVLNSLFDSDPNSKESIVMIENKSSCNIIMRIEGIGNQKFNLPIPTKAQNTIVVPKGDYLFTSIVCGAQYASQKTVQKAIVVSLSDPRSN